MIIYVFDILTCGITGCLKLAGKCSYIEDIDTACCICGEYSEDVIYVGRYCSCCAKIY